MEILLIFVFVAAVAALLHRWHIATSGQRLADPPGPDPTPVPGRLPLRASAQMRRAMRARGTYVAPQHTPPQHTPPQHTPPPVAPQSDAPF
ncbi:hypothetical protein [Cryptosporangium arvum]|uniref:hypothetical protein n=1 Tax=Cryptosporangium arvum TaxID=80871 RepID=UPI0004B50FA6|nr:hypothetical protein [Cryptosporangium arvum]